MIEERLCWDCQIRDANWVILADKHHEVNTEICSQCLIEDYLLIDAADDPKVFMKNCTKLELQVVRLEDYLSDE